MYAQFLDSNFSRSRDINGAPTFRIGYVTLATPL